MVGAQDEAVAFQLAQPLGQHLGRDRADVPLQFDEAQAALLVEAPEDRRGPPAEDQVDHRADRAGLSGAGRAREDAVRQSGLEWTILRAGGFDSNAYAWAESVRAGRTVSAPFGDVGLPTVDPDDIAEVAAAVLRGQGHDGQGHGGQGHDGKVYELTGPAPVTPRQMAEAIAVALGEPVRFVEKSVEEARARMLEFMPAPVVTTTLEILGAPTAAEQRISPDVERILGHPAGTFAAWAERSIAAFG